MSAEIRELELRRRDGTVAAVALVDEDDWQRLSQYRWWLTPNGYAMGYLGVNPGTFLHRAVLELPNGDLRRADHINRDRLDCRKANLRIVTQAQNNQNVPARKGSTSRYRGVSFHPHSGLWHARAMVAGRQHSLGYFPDEIAASEAAAEFRAKHMPYSQEAQAA